LQFQGTELFLLRGRDRVRRSVELNLLCLSSVTLFLFVLLLNRSYWLDGSGNLFSRLGLGLSCGFGLGFGLAFCGCTFGRGLSFFRSLSLGFSFGNNDRGRSDFNGDFLNLSPFLHKFCCLETDNLMDVVSDFDNKLTLTILVLVLELTLLDGVTGQLVGESLHELDRALSGGVVN